MRFCRVRRTNCTDGYLKIFLKGQETQDAYDKFDYELCGFDIPHSVVSDGPRLAMVFSSGELQARGFKVCILCSLYCLRAQKQNKKNV